MDLHIKTIIKLFIHFNIYYLPIEKFNSIELVSLPHFLVVNYLDIQLI